MVGKGCTRERSAQEHDDWRESGRCHSEYWEFLLRVREFYNPVLLKYRLMTCRRVYEAGHEVVSLYKLDAARNINDSVLACLSARCFFGNL